MSITSSKIPLSHQFVIIINGMKIKAKLKAMAFMEFIRIYKSKSLYYYHLKFTEDGVAGEYGKTAVKPVVEEYRDAGGLAIIPSRPMVDARALGREVGAGSVMSHRVQVTLITI